jgi:DNA-binding NarL/FixJ family response regulator
MGNPIRVLVVDDHEMLAEALGLLFSRHPVFELVGCAPGAERAVEMTTEEHPDVVLLDLELPGLDGPAATRRIKGIRPSTKVVAVTSLSDPEAAAAVVAAGASGYVQKTRPVEEVLELVRRAAAGEIVTSHAELAEALDRLPAGAVRPQMEEARLRRLTARETQILHALAAGDSISAVADDLRISPLTVESHVKSILSKLEVHSKIEAVTLAWRHGLAPAAPRT